MSTRGTDPGSAHGGKANESVEPSAAEGRPSRTKWIGVGLDGCKSGWVAARWDGRTLGFAQFASIDDWAEDPSWQAEPALIDIPIGLLDGSGEDVRTCDALARGLLGPRRSSVFAAPGRAAVDAPDYPAANRANRKALGKGLSKQAYYLIPKVREVDRWLRAGADGVAIPERLARLAESHPELVFAFAQAESESETDGAPLPMAMGKKTAQGQRDRRKLLEALMPGCGRAIDRARGRAIDRARGRMTVKDVADDDLLDAAVLAWASLVRAEAGERRSIPATPPLDAYGLPMRMLVRTKTPAHAG
ncbi:MAG: DUF429 domain-containing protein [Planctomycetota bacterium]